jgi:hypothetical protein
MKTRIIHTKFWIDSYVSTLTIEQKLIFLYYLTNDKVNIIHFYECPDRQVLFDTGVSTGVLQGCKKKFQKDNKILFFEDYVLLKNALRYERYEGSDNLKAKEKLIAQLSKEALKLYEESTPLSQGSDTPLTGTINHNTEIINNKSETINHNKEEYSRFSKYKKEALHRIGKPIICIILLLFPLLFTNPAAAKFKIPSSLNKKEWAVIKKYPNPELIVKIYQHESTLGKNDICRNFDKFNGFGWNEWPNHTPTCYNSFNEVVAIVSAFLNKYKYLGLEKMGCLYITGDPITNCSTDYKFNL